MMGAISPRCTWNHESPGIVNDRAWRTHQWTSDMISRRQNLQALFDTASVKPALLGQGSKQRRHRSEVNYLPMCSSSLTYRALKIRSQVTKQSSHELNPFLLMLAYTLLMPLTPETLYHSDHMWETLKRRSNPSFLANGLSFPDLH